MATKIDPKLRSQSSHSSDPKGNRLNKKVMDTIFGRMSTASYNSNKIIKFGVEKQAPSTDAQDRVAGQIGKNLD